MSGVKKMQNYKLTLCYDGTKYRGWQRQGNTPNTIQEKMEYLLSRVLGRETEIAASGRTDAGVHARRQVCSFRAEMDAEPEELLRKLREVLPEDIGAVSLERAEPRFHARLSCREKTYVYRLWTSTEPNVFLRRYTLSCPAPLDEAAMKAAAEALVGRHDFSAFCARSMKKSAVRSIRSIAFQKEGGELRLVFTGDGFLYNMVSILAGTLLEVGAGRLSPGEMPGILASKDRAAAGPCAPAKGLFLWEVSY